MVGHGPRKGRLARPKLPTGYVSTVFAQMSPDSVGPIMDALPSKVAALIVESGTKPSDFGSTGPINRIAGLARPFAVPYAGLSIDERR